MKRKCKNTFILIILLFILFFYLVHSSYMIQEFLDYSLLFLTKFVPVSFPFLVLSSLLIQYHLIDIVPFHSRYFTIFFLSLISGFPSGAKYTRDLWEKKILSTEESNQVLLFCHFPNPLFVLGSVAMVCTQRLIPLKILFAVILSNTLIFLFVRKRRDSFISEKVDSEDFSVILKKTIFSVSQTILLIYGTSIIFYLVLVLILKYFSLSIPFFVLLCGIFDLTKGVFATTMMTSILYRSYFILFFISFGSISIHMQVKSILVDTPLSYHFFLLGRFVGTILAFLIFTLLIMGDLLQW